MNEIDAQHAKTFLSPHTSQICTSYLFQSAASFHLSGQVRFSIPQKKPPPPPAPKQCFSNSYLFFEQTVKLPAS